MAVEIVSVPIKSMVKFSSYVSYVNLPEGKSHEHPISRLFMISESIFLKSIHKYPGDPLVIQHSHGKSQSLMGK